MYDPHLIFDEGTQPLLLPLHSFHAGDETTTTTYLVSDLIASPLGQVSQFGEPASGQAPYKPEDAPPAILVNL